MIRKSKKRRGIRSIRTTTLDTLWAKVIKTRARWVCEKCIEDPESKEHVGRALQAAHIFSRSKHVTRWDTDNGISLCTGHHMWGHREPLAFHLWVQKKLGEDRYQALLIKHNAGVKTNLNRDTIKTFLNALLKKYEERNQQPLGTEASK